MSVSSSGGRWLGLSGGHREGGGGSPIAPSGSFSPRAHWQMLWGFMKDATSRNGFERFFRMNSTAGRTASSSLPLVFTKSKPCAEVSFVEKGRCHLRT